MSQKRVAVFIDNSNVLHNIRDIRKSGDKGWISLYDPLKLSQKLVGNRNLVFVGFYCTRPPAYLLKGTEEERKHFNITTKYYSEIEKVKEVSVRYGELKGTRGALIEKNLDTQLGTDMLTMAALDEYDAAILISNDGDYQSVVKSVKEKFSKKVEVIFFQGGLSMALRRIADITRRARRSYFEKFDDL